MSRTRTLVAAVAGHVVLSVGHGLVHLAIPVHLHGWQYGYAGAVIVLAPVVGAVLVVRDRAVAGVWLVALSGVAALAFEALFHFGIANPDHVAAVERGRTLFAATAVLSTAGDAVLVAVAVWACGDLR